MSELEAKKGGFKKKKVGGLGTGNLGLEKLKKMENGKKSKFHPFCPFAKQKSILFYYLWIGYGVDERYTRWKKNESVDLHG